MKTKGKIIRLGSVNITKKQLNLICQTLKSNRLTYGPITKRFESKFSELHNRKFGVFVSSGTAGLIIAIATLKELFKWNDGDEILVPAITFIATSNAVIINKLKPVFIDVHPQFYNIDVNKIESKISEKTRAIIPVHAFGLPCEMDEINEIAKCYNLKIIEDSCEAVYVKYKGKPVGAFSELAVFSFYAAHILVTGVGGMVIGDEEVYETYLRSVSFHGRSEKYLSADIGQIEKEKLSEIIENRFLFTRFGYNFRLTELEAALGLAQLSYLHQIIIKRQTNACYLNENLKDLSEYLQLPTWPSYSEHAFMMYPIVIRSEKIDRKKLIMHLEENGIETRYMLPLINQPVYKRTLNINENDYPSANYINKKGFYIGCHQDLNKDDLDYIIDIFHDYFKKQK